MDLHRDLRQEVTNQALLEADRERYVEEEPAIQAPELIIVSGDINHEAGARRWEAAACRRTWRA